MGDKRILVLAGLDPTGGAGLLADVSILREEGIHSLGVPTALTIQSGEKVQKVERVSARYFERALSSATTSLPPDGIKIGMIFSAPIGRATHKFLEDRRNIPAVLDPVLFASGGEPLILDETMAVLKMIIPLCNLVTPNIGELDVLAELFNVKGTGIEKRGLELSGKIDVPLLVKGGHRKGEKGVDLLFSQEKISRFHPEKVGGKDFHGTGCALSSLIAAMLVKGHSLKSAISFAKKSIEMRMAKGWKSPGGRWFLSS